MMTVMSPRLWQVDAFAETPFEGNPAAVCVLDAAVEDGWMRAVARETMAPATAFATPGSDAWGLRWFSPHAELRLCGHATLATAHILSSEQLAPPDSISFTTRFSGTLHARAEDGAVALDLPADPLGPVEPPEDLAAGHAAVGAWRGRIGFVLELPDPDAVRAARVDRRIVDRYPDADLVLTAAGGQRDFISRVFVPGHGEDMVTGSAHCALGPLWAARLGRDEVAGYQASARGGIVRIRVQGERVELAGRAVTVARGELLV